MSKRIRSQGGLPPDRYLTHEQVQQLRKHLREQMNHAKSNGCRRAIINEAIIDLMLNTGLRAAEVCQLQMRDLPHVHGKPVIDVREGKGCIRRNVCISSALASRIKQFVKKYRRSAKHRSYLFVNERGGPLSYRSIYSRIRIVGQAAGFPNLHPHMLRHSYSMSWYERWKDPYGLQSQLGHKDVKTTNIYARTTDEKLRRQAEDFDL